MTRFRYLTSGAQGNYGGEGDSTFESLISCYGANVTNRLIDNGARAGEWHASDEEDAARECDYLLADGECIGTFYELLV